MACSQCAWLASRFTCFNLRPFALSFKRHRASPESCSTIMNIFGLIYLIIVAACAVHLWRLGTRLCADFGVTQRCACWLIAAIIPKAILVLAVHIPASVSLFTDIRAVSPLSIACTYAFLTAVVTLLLHRIILTNPPASRPSLQQSSRHRKLIFSHGLCWPIIIVFATYAIFTIDALTRYPTGYDGLHYHLPAAVRWLRTGALDLTINHILHCYPDNAMFVPMLLFAAGCERLVSGIFLPQAVLTAALGYAMTRALRRGPRTAILVATVSAGLPIVIFQSASAYIDLYAATTWLTGLLTILWASRVTTPNQRLGLIILAGMAAGIALGAKTTYLALSPLLGLVALCVNWIRTGQYDWLSRKTFTYAAAFAIPMLLCAGFWFARGTVQAKNPIYPLTFEVGGQKILPGFVAKDWYPTRSFNDKLGHWWSYPWHEAKRAGGGYPLSVNNGLGAAFATLIPPAFILALLSAMTKKPKTPTQRWQFILVALSVIGAVLLLTAFQEMLRFVLPFVIISVVMSAFMLRKLMRTAPRICIATLSVALLVNAATTTIRPATALASRIKDGRWDRSSMYAMPPLIDQLPPGTRFLNLAKPDATYALLGASLTNEVITNDQWFTIYSDGEVTANRLREQSVDYLFAGRGEPMPTSWIDEIPIVLVYDSQHDTAFTSDYPCRIYRVKSTVSVAQTSSTNDDLR